MARLLLAFLGTTDYIPCNYIIGDREPVTGVRFVQEALAKTFCKEWGEDDKIVIYLTSEAEARNWVDDGHRDRDGKPLQRAGLERCLREAGLRCKIVPVRDVAPGRTDAELWSIFDTIVASIGAGDEIIADVTHGFRALPMLMMLVLDYARLVKEARVTGMHYGAIEALGTPKQIEAMPVERRDVHVLDLLIFGNLMDWTQAVESFLDSGNATPLARLARDEAGRMFRAGSPACQGASQAQRFANMLRALAECIRSARGSEIATSFDFRGLKQLLEQVRGCSIKPLDPLLDKIAAKIDRFANDDVHNGFIAVGWCIDHGLVPQGLTLLQETMISERVAKRFGKEHLLDLEKREIVAQALNIGSKGIPEADWKSPAREHQDDVRAVLQDLPAGFSEIFDGLSQARNDINHGGFSPAAAKPAALESRLREYHRRAMAMGTRG